jgi:hypothetical protein
MFSISQRDSLCWGLALWNITRSGWWRERKLVWKKISADEIFAGNVTPPDSAKDLMSTLQEKSPANASKGK